VKKCGKNTNIQAKLLSASFVAMLPSKSFPTLPRLSHPVS
jgi:hypothetical protein